MSTTPLDLAIAAALAARRFGLVRTLTVVLLTAPVWLYSLPPVSCGCFGPAFRRCTSAPYYLAATKSDLKNLASQQEIYFADHGTYSYDPDALGFVTSPGVETTIVASVTGWAARAHHVATPERSCAIYVGDAADFLQGLGPVAASHEIVCAG